MTNELLRLNGLSGQYIWGVWLCTKDDGTSLSAKEETPTFVELWRTFGQFSATDERDKIFALLSLALEPLGIVPNYVQSCQDLPIQVTRNLISITGNLDILDMGFGPTPDEPHPNFSAYISQGIMSREKSFESLEENEEPKAELMRVVYEALEMSTQDFIKQEQCKNETGPSWVPQFCVQYVYQSPFVREQRLEDRAFAAGITFPSKLNYAAIQQFDDPKILSLSGFFFNRVAFIPMPLGMRINSPAMYRIGFELVCSIAGAGFEDIPDESLIDAYWKTLTCDQFHRRSVATQILGFGDPELYQDLARKLSTKEGDKCVSNEDRDLFFYFLKLLCNHGRFGFVLDFFLAMLPIASKEGDIVCIFYGGKSPMVIRPVHEDEDEDKDRYILIGPAYIHGIMDGEALQLQEKMQERGVFKERKFHLV